MTPTRYHLDFETFSEADLKTCGAFKYAEHSSTEILCMALRRNHEPPVVWRCDGPSPGGLWKSPQDMMRFRDYMDEIEQGECLVYAHNALFEIAITRALWVKTFGRSMPLLSQWRCTMAMARKAVLPRSLAKLAEYLGISEQKDKRGAALIRLFCILQKPKKATKHKPALGYRRVRPQDNPTAFQELVDYCVQDVLTESAAFDCMEVFDLKGTTLESFQFDLAMNMRGVPVNVMGLELASKIMHEVTDPLAAEFRNITGLEVTQGRAFLPWLKQHGYKGGNLQADTVEGELDEDVEIDVADTASLDPCAKRALSLFQQCSYAAVKKVPAMLNYVCADGRMRGLFNWHEASTGRWTSGGPQLQNFRRPTRKDTELIYSTICHGANAAAIDVLFGPPLEMIAEAIRHFVDPGESYECEHGIRYNGGQLLNADYSAIEARLAMWMADEEHALQDYRTDVDRYVKMASKIYNVPYDTLLARCEAKDKDALHMRFIGKQCALACQYQTGAGGFIRACENFGITVDAGLAELAVSTFRVEHPKLKALWYAIELACKKAIMYPGQKFPIAGGKCEAFCSTAAGKKFLFIRLPSKRLLAYPDPKVAVEGDYEVRKNKGVEYHHHFKPGSIHFHGNKIGNSWGRIDIYGGMFFENIIQGVSADLMSNGAVLCERAGYEIFALVHDEALADKKPQQTAEEFMRLLTTLPPWAAGLPIASEGGVVSYYSK